MTKPEPKPETILAAQLMQEAENDLVTPYRVARDATRLCALARRARTLAIKQCNGVERYSEKHKRSLPQWTEADQAACDRAKDRIEAQANEILEPYGASVLTVSGDPRGCVMRLTLASGAQNGMGEGWGL